MADTEKLPLAEVYIDESSQTNHRYLVLGGVIAETSDVQVASESIAQARLPELPSGTMKWGKVSRSKLAAYIRVVDRFFELGDTMTLDFHSLVVDTTKQDHARYNQGSRDVGFNKEIYQLATKFRRCYKAHFHIYPDRRTTNQTTEELRLILNRGARKAGDNRDWPFRRVQFREPEECQLLQLADVFAGAIAWHLNGHGNQPNASPAKTELGAHILSAAGVTDVTRDTAKLGRFTIWHRRLK